MSGAEYTVRLRIEPPGTAFGLGMPMDSEDVTTGLALPRYLRLTNYGERYSELVDASDADASYKDWILNSGSSAPKNNGNSANLVVHCRRVSLDPATEVKPHGLGPNLTNSSSSVGVGGNFAASTRQAVNVNGSHFNLPQIFSSRSTAQLDALNIWKATNTSDFSLTTRKSLSSSSNLSLSDFEGVAMPRNKRASIDDKAYPRRMRIEYPLSGSNVSDTKDTSNGSDATSNNQKPMSRKEVGLSPLPFGWAKRDVENSINLSDNDCTVEFVDNEKITTVHEVASVRTLDPIPTQCGIYYFEVEIVSAGFGDESFAVGVCDEKVSMSKFPGFEGRSWAYHGDDGRIVAGGRASLLYGPRFGAGNVIGCGVNFRKKTIFYTKDGVYLKDAFTDVSCENLFPTIGMKTGKKSRANFGQREFCFDIEKYVEEYKKEVEQEILSSEPELDEAGFYYASHNDQVNALVKDIVSSYFKHEGYLEAANAFEQECKQEMQMEEEGQEDENEEMMDALTEEELKTRHESEIRQQIRTMVRQGDIDEALEMLEEHFPSVEETNQLIFFELRCQKFIWLIKQAAESSKNNETSRRKAKSNQHLAEAIEYGQNFRRDYKDDRRPEVKKMLSTLFSLLAYEDPTTEPEVEGLFDNSGLIPLAEEVNSSILAAQGKPSVPFLEKLSQQCIQLIWELSDHGVEAANYINVHRDFLKTNS